MVLSSIYSTRFLKLDADRVALDMCIAKAEKKTTKNNKKKTNDGHFKYFYLSKHPLFFSFHRGVERGRMIGFGTEMMLFFCFVLAFLIIIIIKAMWYRVKADVMCFHHNGDFSDV